MKHYIITRFASWIHPTAVITIEKLFSDEFLKDSFTKLQNALIPTLENQTNKNFTLIINIHNDISTEKVSFLQQINTTFNIKILRSKEISSFISEDSKEEKQVIISRIDIDDFIRKDVVDLIQQYAIKSKEDYIGLGLYNGATMWYQDKTTYLLPTQSYVKSNTAPFSCMCTIIYNNYAAKTWLQYHQTDGPTCYDHSILFVYIKKFINNYCNNSTYSIHFIKEQNINKPLYLWTGYGNNVTVSRKNCQNRIINWHISNVKLNVSLDDYGINL